MSFAETTPQDWDKAFLSAKTSNKEDMVNSPKHYTSGDIECIDGIRAALTPEAFKGYCKGAALKYLWRYENKGKSLEDLHKCKWYLNRLIASVDCHE